MAGSGNSSRIVLAKTDFKKKTEKVRLRMDFCAFHGFVRTNASGRPACPRLCSGRLPTTPDTAGSAMQQIADWLQKLGLGQYAQRFAENEIDVSVLPHLTDQDLKDIGVPLGPRRKILAAITAETGTTNATPEPAASIEPKAQDTAERRQVTVMFSDLVGSTALSARMDPEDLREVISAYQKCVAETVRRFGGFVAKYMGDGVLVYFGYPQAHEDDAERAVRAGLELVEAVDAQDPRAPADASRHCNRARRRRRPDRRRALRRSRRSSARRQTLLRVCRALRSRTAW